jgi:hypothetical protein
MLIKIYIKKKDEEEKKKSGVEMKKVQFYLF